MKPVKALIRDSLLTLAAVDHAVDIGQKGLVGHIGTNGSTLMQRIKKHANPIGEFSENISYGCNTGEEAML